MKTGPFLLVALLTTAVALAQTPRPAASASRAGAGKTAPAAGPDPDLFDGTKFDKENRPDSGMMGEFEMPGSNDPQDKSKVGGNPGQPGGKESTPPKSAAAGGAAGAPSASGGSGGAEAAASAGGAPGGGGASEGAEKSGAGGAVGGALDQSKPMSSSGKSGGGGPSGKAEGMAADNLSGGSASAAQNANQGTQAKSSGGKIGSAELRIEPLPETDKDVIGREAAAGGTQGSNRAMPSGGNTGSTNQNKGVEKGKVIPKGL